MITVILNVFSDYFGRYLIAYGPGKISVFPKFTTPKLFLHLGVLMKNHTRTHTLQYPHYLGNTISRRKRQKYVQMIQSCFHSVNLKPMIQRYILKYTPHTLLYVPAKYPLPILRSSIPNDISCHIRHVAFFSQPCAIHSTFTPAFGRKTFHPRPQDGVFKS